MYILACFRVLVLFLLFLVGLFYTLVGKPRQNVIREQGMKTANSVNELPTGENLSDPSERWGEEQNEINVLSDNWEEGENVKDHNEKNMSVTELNEINKKDTQKELTEMMKLDKTSGALAANKSLVLLAASHRRSGSTLIGEIISAVPGAVFFFEPEYLLHSIDSCAEGQCDERILWQLFTCTFDQTFASVLKNNLIFLYFYSKEIQPCYESTFQVQSDECIKKFDLWKMCQEASAIVVKTVELRLSWIEKILPSLPENLKVVSLIRDPRGTKTSLLNFPWNANTEQLCKEIESDLDTFTKISAKFPDRVMLLNYDRFCAAPYKMTKGLYSFLGYKGLPKATQAYIEEHTNSDYSLSGSLDTVKKSARAYSFWRRSIPEDVMVDVEGTKSCQRVLSLLGLVSFGSIEKARNLSISVFKEDYR
ncbi:carbohydrate sulfotransferase 1-like [Oratosquilla oratoria]|uniref:carbohydrate sulfotransferase 1-like n=1 Tax=Oratosquilla oratoria TaxID=337810 RepID=UPI003F76FADC